MNTSDSKLPVRRDRLTVRVGDEDLLDLAHFDGALLDLVLGCLPAIKKPDISVKSQS